MTHYELCQLAGKYMLNTGTVKWNKSPIVVVEFERVGECPDVFGFGCQYTELIEVKLSRSDFLADKKKYWRINKEFGIGQFRSYLCPIGVIEPKDLPENWGLYYVNDKNKIQMILEPKQQQSNSTEELKIVASILRREGIYKKVLSYKQITIK